LSCFQSPPVLSLGFGQLLIRARLGTVVMDHGLLRGRF
jgi:hypothetical protein